MWCWNQQKRITIGLLCAVAGACAEPPVPAPPPTPTVVAPPTPTGPRGPPLGGPKGKAGVSGAALQDPSGFPEFHSWPAPTGPKIGEQGAFSAPVALSSGAGGGYRPQIAVGDDGALHVVFYSRETAGDLMVHRVSTDGGQTFSAPERLGFDRGRNWGPDLVVRADGRVPLVFDLADPGPASRGYFTEWSQGTWSAPIPLTSDRADAEVGSGHIADAQGDDLVYVWIGKTVGPAYHFAAWSRWRRDGVWGEPVALSDGAADAWHTNVERRPDGSVLVGFDIGTGGAETRLYVAEGRDGAFLPLEDLTASGGPGERPHFASWPAASGGWNDLVTYFHKVGGRPVHVFVRAGGPGRWGPPEEPSRGFGGYHFDPEIAVRPDGLACLVWGWDSGDTAELVYALRSPEGRWSAVRRVASVGAGKPGLASIVAAPDGAFHVVWNQGERGANEVLYARLAVAEAP